MDAFLLYLVKSGSCLMLFYACFKALFSNDTFFRLNRWILLIGTGCCLLLPFGWISIREATLLQQPIIQLERILMGNPVPALETTPTEPQEAKPVTPEPAISWELLIGLLYISGCVACLTGTAFSFHKMYRIIQTGRRVKQGSCILILTPEPLSPFSWGNYIILSEEDYSNNPDEILAHEKIHLNYRHSLDLIYMELVLTLHWYNPSVWLLKQELREIHEYQADKGVLSQGIDATKYQLLLVKKAVGSSLYTLANSFNHSKIKKRITMMLKKRSNNWAQLKLLLLAPVGLLALSVFARSESEPPPIQASPPTNLEQPNEPPMPTTDKSTIIQNDIKEEYDVYLSFTKNNDVGKEELAGMTLYGTREQKALELAEKAIKSGVFKAATKVVICPRTPNVPKSFLEKMKALFDANSIKCAIAQAQGYDKNRNALPPPPPPPPSPDTFVVLTYKSGKKKGEMIVYKQYLQTGKELTRQLDKIYSDDIASITITSYKWTPEGMAEETKQFLKDKIKYDVEYKIEQK